MIGRGMCWALLLCGCTASTPDRDKGASTAATVAATTAGAVAVTTETRAVQPVTPEPELVPHVPRTPFPPISITPQAAKCPALPKTGGKPSREIARVLRQVACTPELFTLAKDELVAKLALPPFVTESYFESAAEIHFAVDDDDLRPTPIALAKALGIARPVARRDEHHSWWLGSDPETGELDRFGPGVITVDIQIGFEGGPRVPPGTVVPLSDEMMILNMGVRLPGRVARPTCQYRVRHGLAGI